MMYPTRPTPTPYEGYVRAFSAASSYSSSSTVASSRSSSASSSPSSPVSTSSTYSYGSTSSDGTHTRTQAIYKTPYPNSLTSQPKSHLPADLSLFDCQPKQNLLGDLEIIFGKELKFPFLEKLRGRKFRPAMTKLECQDDPSCIEKQSTYESVRSLKSRKLRKPNGVWEGDYIFEQGPKKGRGVREGNWI